MSMPKYRELIPQMGPIAGFSKLDCLNASFPSSPGARKTLTRHKRKLLTSISIPKRTKSNLNI